AATPTIHRVLTVMRTNLLCRPAPSVRLDTSRHAVARRSGSPARRANHVPHGYASAAVERGAAPCSGPNYFDALGAGAAGAEVPAAGAVGAQRLCGCVPVAVM